MNDFFEEYMLTVLSSIPTSDKHIILELFSQAYENDNIKNRGKIESIIFKTTDLMFDDVVNYMSEISSLTPAKYLKKFKQENYRNFTEEDFLLSVKDRVTATIFQELEEVYKKLRTEQDFYDGIKKLEKELKISRTSNYEKLNKNPPVEDGFDLRSFKNVYYRNIVKSIKDNGLIGDLKSLASECCEANAESDEELFREKTFALQKAILPYVKGSFEPSLYEYKSESDKGYFKVTKLLKDHYEEKNFGKMKNLIFQEVTQDLANKLLNYVNQQEKNETNKQDINVMAKNSVEDKTDFLRNLKPNVGIVFNEANRNEERAI